MDKQEKIVCAAVKAYVIPHENWYAEPFYHVFKVINYEDYKEEHIYRYLEIFDNPAPVFGFITSKNRFVDAKEAMEIAINMNQINSINTFLDAVAISQDNVNDFRAVGGIKKLTQDLLKRGLKPEDLY